MEVCIFYAMIIVTCYFDPLGDARMSSIKFFKYNHNLDWFLSLFRWLYREEWRDSYSQICWHWIKWFRFFTPFAAYIVACQISWIDVVIGAVFGKIIWRITYNYYTKVKVN